MHVLIADDEPYMCQIISRVVQRHGGTVVAVMDGKAALDYLQQTDQRPDVVVLDIRMPVLNGWDVRTQQLLQPSLAAIPVIFIAGDHPGDRERAATLGAVYLAKPFELLELWELLCQVVKGTARG